MYRRINEKTVKGSVVSLYLIKRENGQNFGTFIGKNIMEPLKRIWFVYTVTKRCPATNG